MTSERRAFWATWALWFAPIVLFRAGILVQPWQGEDLAARATVSAFGLSQDALVAFECMLLLQLVSRATPSARVSSAVALFGLVQGYLLLDLLLFAGTGVRMNAKLLYFVGSARELYDSAEDVGLTRLIVGAIGLVGLAVVAFRRPYGQSPPPAAAAPELAAAGVALLASVAVTQLGTRYYSSNTIIADQLEAVTRALHLDRGVGSWVAVRIPPDLSPRNERFDRVSPNYPLLKDTKGFDGPTTFNLELSPGEKPHVVVVFLESFRAKDVGALGGTHGASPEFDRLSKEGVLFRSFYNNGVQTTRAVLAALYGLYDRFDEQPVQSARSNLPLIGMPHLFKRNGYRTAYFHNGSLTFEKKNEFFPVQGYDEVYGAQHVAEASPNAERTSWGVHDEYLMPFVLDWLERADSQGQPSFVTTFTVSHHHPWTPPSHYSARVSGPPDNPHYAAYLRTFNYSDHCLGAFVERLRASGLSKKTIVIVLGDHSQPMGEHDANFMLIRNLYEENLRIPLLVLADGRLDAPATIDQLGSEVDLVPTVMDMLQLTGANHAVGSSLRRKDPDRAVFFSNPFGVGWVGLRQGPWKLIHLVETDQTMLFDLSKDPLESLDLSRKDPALAKSLRERALGVQNFVVQLIEHERISPPADARNQPRGSKRDISQLLVEPGND
ncbi:MAG: LTA synthase family protein [Deltaproteobacteria bacterium]|nr:LTA synthase family protein [Deltaproteobacteria bacterium]